MSLLKKLDDGIYASDGILDDLRKADSIIFDCDGVLVDVRKSYDLAIKETADYMLKNVASMKNPPAVDSDIIDAFKSTGGFNDEIDVTYAVIISSKAAELARKDPQSFLIEVAKNADSSGIISVEKYIAKYADMSEFLASLGYPPDEKSRADNLLCSVFYQLFYGPELYLKLFGRKSRFDGAGFIENENVIVTGKLVDKLRERFDGRVAIVTGRGIDSVRYAMKDLTDKFDVESSAFLEDEPRHMAKPNPESLIRSISKMGSSHCVFVGDSMEDCIMADKATRMGHKTTFVGITGTSDEPERKLGLFEERGALIVIDSIHKLPKVLNLV